MSHKKITKHHVKLTVPQGLYLSFSQLAEKEQLSVPAMITKLAESSLSDTPYENRETEAVRLHMVMILRGIGNEIHQLTTLTAINQSHQHLCQSAFEALVKMETIVRAKVKIH